MYSPPFVCAGGRRAQGGPEREGEGEEEWRGRGAHWKKKPTGKEQGTHKHKQKNGKLKKVAAAVDKDGEQRGTSL